MKRSPLALKPAPLLIAGAVALIAATSVSFGIVHAQSGNHAERHASRINQLFERFDLNKDDSIDSSEIEAARAAHFNETDTNADGAISLEEMTAAAQRRAADRASSHFARMDTNADGKIDKTEIAARGAHKGGHGFHHHGHGQMLERMDTDGDGKISREEALSARPGKGQRH